MPLHWLRLIAMAVCLAAGAPRIDSDTIEITWTPKIPREGSLVVLSVGPADTADDIVAVRGELAGEPLHFERAADGFHALGAVSFGSTRGATVRVVVERAGGEGGGGGDTLVATLPVRPRRTRRERLRVAPEFAKPPDSLAERIRIEREIVQEVRQRAQETPRLWEAPFVRPNPAPVTSGFGVPRVFNGVVQSRHYGVDFGARRGAPVQATNRGVVAFVADLYYSGTTVFIDHGAGLLTGYFHLSRVQVVPGDTVERGQVVGLVGSSGRVTRPHLHWFGSYGRVTVDPLDLVNLGASLQWEAAGPATTRRTDAQR